MSKKTVKNHENPETPEVPEILEESVQGQVVSSVITVKEVDTAEASADLLVEDPSPNEVNEIIAANEKRRKEINFMVWGYS